MESVLFIYINALVYPDFLLLCFDATEPSAPEGQLHGGASRRSQEASARLPLYGLAALRQAEKTDRRVKKTKNF